MKSTKEIYMETVQVPFWETKNNHILGYVYESLQNKRKEPTKISYGVDD
jgi:hypothetical protein